MADANDVVKDGSSSKDTTSKSSSSKPVKYPELFYSPDYKQIFNSEIEEISLELLQSAETILTNFNFKTIDSVSESRPVASYDSFGVITGLESKEPQEYKNIPDIGQSENMYNISDLVIIPIRNSIEKNPNNTHATILSNFGSHSSGPDIEQYRPGYLDDGTPYYDLEISPSNIGGILGYNIYMIEEVEK